MKTIHNGNAVTFALAHPQSTVELPIYGNNTDLTGDTPVIMSFDSDKKVSFYHNTVIDMENAKGVRYKPESVTEEAIKGHSVTEAKMADKSISTRCIDDASVVEAKMADGSVSTRAIVDGAVIEGKIGTNAVTAVKLANGAVTTAKLYNRAVTREKMAVNSIETIALVNGSVSRDKLANGAVTSDKLAIAIEFKTAPTISGGFVDEKYVNGTYNDTTKNVLTNANWVRNYTLSDNSGLARKASNERITGSWTFDQDINGIAVKAKWADLAESYQADADYPVGTLVCFGGEKEITVATSHANAVVSEQPALHMNAEMENGLPIALSGRVRVRVVGKVEKFDKIILSDLSGVGVADNCSCGTCVVGRALESKETEEEGLVLCVVALNLD